jgi:uncharacterized protein YbjT (DUF2867 family)
MRAPHHFHRKELTMYVLLGSSGQITTQLAHRLLGAGHPVRIVGRNRNALTALEKAGAQLAVGDPGDAAFLERAFSGATAAYTMTPPCYSEPDMRAAQDRVGSAIAQALRKARVPRVVNLSSVGAELAEGTGPIAGLHAQEQRLAGMSEVLHLRPGSFMENYLAALHPVVAAGVLPGLESPDATIPLVATRDIAAVAARELTQPRRTGVLILHAPQHATPRTVAAVLGEAIGQPGMPYVQTSPAEMKAVLLAQGFSSDAAHQLEVLARWLSTSPLASVSAAPVEVQPTTLEMFARDTFAPAIEASRTSLAPV